MANTTIRPMVRIHDLLTDEITDREMSDSEYTNYLAEQKVNAAQEAEATAKAEAKQAVLDKLGLSAEEVAALLG